MGNIEHGGYILYRRKASSWKRFFSFFFPPPLPSIRRKESLDVIEIVSLSCVSVPFVFETESEVYRVEIERERERGLDWRERERDRHIKGLIDLFIPRLSHDGSHLQVKSTFDPDLWTSALAFPLFFQARTRVAICLEPFSMFFSRRKKTRAHRVIYFGF